MLTAAVGAAAALAPASTAHAVEVSQGTSVDPVVRLSDRAHDRSVRQHVRLYRVNARLKGAEAGDRRTVVADWSTQHVRERTRELRHENRRLRRAAAAPAAAPAASAGLEAIAACESGGNPSAVSADGTYRGKYQFDQQTWQAVGGSGDPAAAPEAEQDRRAAMLQAQSGSTPWPNCG